MQTLLRSTTRSGTCAAKVCQRLPLSLSLPSFLISGKSKPLFGSYDAKRPNLFRSRVSSSTPSKALPSKKKSALQEYLKFFAVRKRGGCVFNKNIGLHLANRVLHKNVSKRLNTLISPLSFRFLLSLIAAGSKGNTLQQLLKCLNSESLEDINSISSKMISLANVSNGNTGDPSLSFVNGVWVDSECLKLKPSYQETAEVVFNATAKQVNFVNNNADQVVANINGWAETSSSGLIKNLLTSSESLTLKSIDEYTALILANAVYFKGTWAQRFDPSKTKNRLFYLENGQTVDVPFMVSEEYEYFRYLQCTEFKILKLPYQYGQNTGNFAMYIFLPNAVDGLKKILKEFRYCPNDFFNRGFDLPLKEIPEIWIPRFKFSFEFEASDALKKLGLNLPFDRRKAEITKMVDDSSRRPYVKKMLHKAVIEVNGEGTENAAPFRPPGTRNTNTNIPIFVADRPFLFMIKEETSDIVFFVGAVYNPLLQS